MSIIVKGMEMPKTCGECSFLQESVWKGELYPCVCVAGGFVVKPSETDMKDGLCPLVALPEKHGRLIDANKLKLEYPHDSDWDYPVNTNCYVSESIDNAPTVIEAEDGT